MDCWIVEQLSSLTEQPLPVVEQTVALAEQTKSGPAAAAALPGDTSLELLFYANMFFT